jgi:hypothetical protein
MTKVFDQQEPQPKSDLARSLNAALSGCTEWVAAPPRPRTNTLMPALPRQEPYRRRAA